MALLFKMIYRRRFLSLFTIGLSGLSAAAVLWWNAHLSSIINSVSAGIRPSSEMILQAAAAMLMLSAANYMKGFLSGYTCESMSHDLRMRYADYFISLPYSESEKLNAGEQLSGLQNELAAVSGCLNANLFPLIDDLAAFLSTFLWLLFLSPELTLAANLPAFLIVAYAAWSGRIISSAVTLSQQAKGLINRYADILLTLFPVIRLYDASRMTFDGYKNAVCTWELHTIRAERTKARLMSLSGLLSSIPLLFLFLIGGRLVIRGTLTIGTLYIFLNLSGNVSGVLMNMPGRLAAFHQFTANMKRLSPYMKPDRMPAEKNV